MGVIHGYGVEVKELINEDRMTWKVEVIDQTFWPEEAAIIKQIPLTMRRPMDKLIWTGTKDGTYSMQSAYQMLIARNETFQLSYLRAWCGITIITHSLLV